MKQRRFLWFSWILVLFVAAMIFYFSTENADLSSRTSGEFTRWAVHLIHPDFDSLPAGEQESILERAHFIVRKGAHFTEFALLGASLGLLLQAMQVKKRKLGKSWIIGTLYACTDEMHQMFVDGRAAAPLDVGIDSAGVLFGAAAVAVLIWLAGRRRKMG